MNIDKQIKLYNAAIEVVNFCYDKDGNWIGTENIRKSGKFLEIVSNLVDVLEDIQPLMEGWLKED